LIVAGRVVMKMLPVLQRIWLQMPEPKWCISMGACACTGGVFDTYAVVLGVDRFIPVDIYVPGCPPRPEQLLASIIDLQDAIKKYGTLTGKEFADRRTSLGPAPLSLDELRRSRDYLLTKAEQDDSAQEQGARTPRKQHPCPPPSGCLSDSVARAFPRATFATTPALTF